MSPEELHVLLEEYRDGTITPADARRLADAIRADPDVAARVRRDLEFSGHVARALEGDDAEAFARSFAERLRAERAGAEFVSAFEKRIRTTARMRRVEPSKASRVPFFLAAGILLAILGLFVARGPRPAPVVVEQSRREERVPEPLPEEAPKPEAPAGPPSTTADEHRVRMTPAY